MNEFDEKDKKAIDEDAGKSSVSQNNYVDDAKSWAEEAKQELEDFIESQGIYIRQ
jgi:hypothetical protein